MTSINDIRGEVPNLSYPDLLRLTADLLQHAAENIPEESNSDEADQLAALEERLGHAIATYFAEAFAVPSLEHFHDAFWQGLGNKNTARLLNLLEVGTNGLPNKQLILELAEAMSQQQGQLWYHLIVKVTKLQ